MNPYTIALDVWEGALDIDEQVLWDGMVRGLIIRLNDMNGGHHPDQNFSKQWEQAERFARMPYFVFNPWVSGKINVEWMGDHLPPGVKRVGVDIEVKRQGYSPAAYAAEVDGFVNMAVKHWSIDIYTGQWFVPMLAYWPKSIPYWWARYPLSWYPKESTPITWAQIHEKAKAVRWAPGCTLGLCEMWQISGDRYKPPGCAGRAVDINLTRLTEPQLYDYFGSSQPKVSWAWQVTHGLRSLGQMVDDPPD